MNAPSPSQPRRPATGPYLVILPGEFGPAFKELFLAMGVRRIETANVVRVIVHRPKQIYDVIERLRQRGGVILELRIVGSDPIRATA